jgi:translation elongation factor EF-Ts
MNKTEKVIAPLPHAVFAYVHHNRSVAAIVTLRCKTDFALRTDLLQKVGNQLAMQAAAFGKLDPEAPWMLDSTKKVKDIISEISFQLDEPVLIDQVAVQGTSISD